VSRLNDAVVVSENPPSYVDVSTNPSPPESNIFSWVEVLNVLTSTYMFHEIPTEIRKQVFSEISRVLKKDGIFVLTDSLQIDDNPKLNPLLEFFPYSTHEPFYPKYIREDLKEVAKNYGLEMYYNKNAYLSKSMAFRKL